MNDDKIEFRCPAAMKRRLLELRPLLGARNLSELARMLLEWLIDHPDDRNPWAVVPALKDVALNLDRIASALQRCLLDGSPPAEHLRDLPGLITRIRDLLDGQSSGASRPRGCR